MEPIKNICCRSGGAHAGLCMFIGMVLEASGIGAIQYQRTETRDEGHIREYSPCSARLIQMRHFALQAFFKFSIWTSIADT